MPEIKYTVKKGDTLSAIAKRFGVKISDITGYRSGNPNLIYPGETLTIRSLSATPGVEPSIGKQTRITPKRLQGEYTADQLRQMGFSEAIDTPSGGTRTFGGIIYKIEATPRGTRVLTPVGGETGLVAQPELQLQQPKRPDEVSKFLNALQDTIVELKQKQKKSDIEIMNEIRSKVLPKEPIPETPDLIQTFEQLRIDQGIPELEDQLNALRAAERDIEARLRQRRQAQLDKPVAMNVIAGRVSEVERQEMERLDFIRRQKAYVVDELKTRYSVVDTYINLTQTNFENAMKVYNTKFKINMQIYDAFLQQERATRADLFKAISLGLDIAEFEEKRIERRQATALANLKIIQDAIKEGSVSWNILPEDTKILVQKLELQAGLPVGFTQSLRPTEEVVYKSERLTPDGTKVADIIIRNADTGAYEVKTIALGKELIKSGGGGRSTGVKPSTYRKYLSKALKILRDVDENYRTYKGKLIKTEEGKGDKRLSLQEFELAAQRILEEVGDPDIAMQVLDEAFSTGGYQRWRW